MAQGRMLLKKISRNRDLPRLIALVDERMGAPHGAYAALVFSWAIAHLDVAGRIPGEPEIVKGEVVPRIPFVSPEHIEQYLGAMHELKLVVWYEARGDRWLAFPGFDGSQPGLRKDRESPSQIPPPPPPPPSETEQLRSNSGSAPETAGETPSESKGKGREREGEGEEKASRTPAGVLWAVDVPRLKAVWTDVAKVVPHNGLSTFVAEIEGLARNHDPPLDGNALAERYLRAFVEWAEGITDESRRPGKSPKKLMDNWEIVADIVAGRRRAKPKQKSNAMDDETREDLRRKF